MTTAVSIEEVLWSCACGAPMGLEINGHGGWFNLDCSHCGLVGSLSVRYKTQLKPVPIKKDQPSSRGMKREG